MTILDEKPDLISVAATNKKIAITTSTDAREKLNKIKCFLLDMDGTVYLSGTPIKGAGEAIERMRKQAKVLFLTNNTSVSRLDYKEKLCNMGITVTADDIYTAGNATIDWLNKNMRGKSVFLLGTEKLKKEFISGGINLVNADDIFSAETNMTSVNNSAACGATNVSMVNNSVDFAETNITSVNNSAACGATNVSMVNNSVDFAETNMTSVNNSAARGATNVSMINNSADFAETNVSIVNNSHFSATAEKIKPNSINSVNIKTPDLVVIGFDTTLTYKNLTAACGYIRQGVPYIATHPDFNCPVKDGYIPDVGSFLALINASCGTHPLIICGKPNAPIAEGVASRTGVFGKDIAMVGDRLMTDMRFAINNGFTSVLVLSGEATKEDLNSSKLKIDVVLNSIADF